MTSHGVTLALLVALMLSSCKVEDPIPAVQSAGQPRAAAAAVAQPSEQAGSAQQVLARCPSDDYDRCFDAAMARLRGDDTSAGAAMLGEACDADHHRACFKLGELVREGRAGPRTPGEGEELIARACRGGHSAACDALGH